MGGVLASARGCMLYNTALEVSAYDRQICEAVEAGIREIENLLVKQVQSAQHGGEIDFALDPLMLARIVMAAMQSMTVRGGANGSREVLESIRDGAMLVFAR